MKFLKFILHLPRHTLILLISLYQKTLSPDHSWLKIFFSNGCCRSGCGAGENYEGDCGEDGGGENKK